ncbi:MAG TPA: APC family permease [Pyrinomonadaceae bacterium]|jgi:amino acid transporter|nr:APC family permease [Pyrinomonadaceae bacterium]
MHNLRSHGHLLRVLGVGFGLAVTIGGTIGMGILRTPGDIATQLPTPTLFIGIWIVGGLYALLGAISIAELGAAIPRSGGFYVFAHRALGNYAGFIVGWSDWMSTCATLAVISMVVGEYLGVLVPTVANKPKAVALTVVLFFALLQWRGIRWGSFTQNITSLLKVVVFVAFVVLAFLHEPTRATNAAPSMKHGFALLAAIILALQGVLYTYDGWYGICYFGGEIRDPKRDVTRSMFGGVLSVIAIYVLVNFALLHVMPLSEIAGEPLAVGKAASLIFGRYGDSSIRALAIVSMLSTINAYTLSAPRTLYAMSCDRLFTHHGTTVNKGGTPTMTLFISTIVAVLFIISGTFNQVLAVIAFFFVSYYTMAFISVFVLRKREPDLPRPYRVWGYPWTTIIVTIGSIAFLAGAVAGDTKNSLWALALLAISGPVYLLIKRFGHLQGSER